LSAGAYRAAGQAVAAILNGVAIVHVDRDGVELAPHTGRCHRAETLAEIAIGLAGIAAEDRYRFGTIDPADFVASWVFDADQLADFAIVRALIDTLDRRGSDDTLFLAWRHALDLIADPTVWRMVESVVAALDGGPLGEAEMRLIMDKAGATVTLISKTVSAASGI
jgi:hypothetical protein